MVVEDDRAIADLVGLYLRRAGSASRSSATGGGARRDPPRPAGRGRARRRAAGDGRRRGLPTAARRGRLDAGALRHRPRRRGRPHGRPGAGRRRLRHQAVQPARARRPRQRPCCAAPSASSAATEVLAVGEVPARRRPPRARTPVRAEVALPPPSSTCWPTSCARPAGCSPGSSCCGGVGVRAAAGTRTVDVHVAQLRAKLGSHEPDPHGAGRRVCGAAAGPRVRSARPVRKRLRPTLATRIALLAVSVAV